MMPLPALTALIYEPGDSVAEIMNRVAAGAQNDGMVVRGLLEEWVGAAEKHRCDMMLRLVGSEHVIKISQDRGVHAKGCRLDLGELTHAAELLVRDLSCAPCDLLIINKFGKSECEGTGLRHLLVHAMDLSVPVIIAVPRGNLRSWREFVGDMAVEIDVSELEARDAWPLLCGKASEGMAA